MSESSICSDCPVNLTLEVSQELVNQFPGNDASKALGGIAITKISLEKTASKINCPGRFQNTNTGQIDCPIREATYGARNMGTSVWNPNGFRIPLDTIISNEKPDNSQHGQYL